MSVSQSLRLLSAILFGIPFILSATSCSAQDNTPAPAPAVTTEHGGPGFMPPPPPGQPASKPTPRPAGEVKRPLPAPGGPGQPPEGPVDHSDYKEALRIQRLKRLDTDSDGLVSLKEYLSAMAKQFKELDQDGDMKLNAAELTPTIPTGQPAKLGTAASKKVPKSAPKEGLRKLEGPSMDGPRSGQRR